MHNVSTGDDDARLAVPEARTVVKVGVQRFYDDRLFGLDLGHDVVTVRVLAVDKDEIADDGLGAAV